MTNGASVLVLNFSYEPLNVVSVKRAVQLLYAKKAEIVEAKERLLHAEKISFPLPSILRLLYYVSKRRNTVALTKKNVLLRDDYLCGYCGVQGGAKMTVDHVIPRSQGGPSNWTNLVACCIPCNTRKRNRTPAEAGMPLRKQPHKPSYIPWVAIKRHTVPTEWAKYLTLYGVSIGIEERVT